MRRRRMGGALALVVMAALVVAGAVSFDRWVDSFVLADNHGRTPVPPTPPDAVDHALRLEVGSPPAVLDVWVLDPEEGDARGTVLVLHGVHADKGPMLGLGERLTERGLRAVLLDLRGHGGSGGGFLTYGVRDARDLVGVLDELDARGLLARPVGVHGPSYGGAAALQVARRDPRVARFVTVSTFASAHDLASSYTDLLSGGLGALLPDVVSDAIVSEGSRRAGVNLFASDSVRAIRDTAAPGLLMHGDRDTLIPFTQAERLAVACGPRCELVRLHGMDHRGALASPEASRRAVDFFAGGVEAVE